MSAITLLRKNNICGRTASCKDGEWGERRRGGEADPKYAELKELGSHPEMAAK